MSSSSVSRVSWKVSLVGLQYSGHSPLPALTIPELLLILEIIRHLKFHVVVAGLLPESSSPATKGLKGCAKRRKLVVDGQLFASSPTCRRRFTGVRLVRHRVYFGRSLPGACRCNTNEHPASCRDLRYQAGDLTQNVLAPLSASRNAQYNGYSPTVTTYCRRSGYEVKSLSTVAVFPLTGVVKRLDIMR